MRRRPPKWIELSDGDLQYLRCLIRDGTVEQRVARRARILLAMAMPSSIVEDLAEQVGQSRQTIWNLCRRYERLGVEAVLDAKRSGRPRQISPP